jgi:hypothetical protein
MLDNIQIDRYMKKVEKKHPHFIYIGTLPSNIHPRFRINNNFDYGIVFNIDPSNKPGSHWVSVFIDNHPKDDHTKSVEYYDSCGCPPPKRIDRYLKKQFGDKGYKYKINDVIHQNYLIKRGRRKMINNMCGVYAINFIERRLHGESFVEATDFLETDNQIIKKFDVVKK